jgi:hypothetical protein
MKRILQMEEQLYRHQRPGEFAICGTAYNDGHEIDVQCGDKPHNHINPVSLWRCDNDDCCSRTIRISEVCYPSPPTIKYCPNCRKEMRLESYVRVELLLPVNVNEKAIPEWLANSLSNKQSTNTSTVNGQDKYEINPR